MVGANPNLPGIMTDKVFASRKTIIDTEANGMIRRALRTKVRTAEQMYMNGDIVFYKREGKEFVRVSPRTDCAKLILLKVMRNTRGNVNTGKNDAQIKQKDTACNGEKGNVLTETDSQIISEEIARLDDTRPATETQMTERSILR